MIPEKNEKILFLGPSTSGLITWLRQHGEQVIHTMDKFNPEFVDQIEATFLISFGYRHILKNDVIDKFAGNAINLHISYLPWNRGVDPNFWSFVDDTPKGVTIHYLDDGIDTGDILAQKQLFFNTDEETLLTTYDRLNNEIELLFKQSWRQIKSKTCRPLKQRGEGSYHEHSDFEKWFRRLPNGWNTTIKDLKKLLKKGDGMKSLPYGKHYIDTQDRNAVLDVLKSDWLTTGPKVEEFEQKTAALADVAYAAAVSSGTAALHAAMFAIGLQPGDEVVVPPITFAATANAVVYQGGTPIFADVNSDTLLIDPEAIEKKITSRTRAVIAVDYAGQMCDYDALRSMAQKHDLYLIADACHSIGGCYKGIASGNCADMSVFSFHPVKHITTGEGGMVVSGSSDLIERVKRFRNHGINTDFRQREAKGSWYYEIEEMGFNYRMSDLQCALGISQLEKLKGNILKRNKIAQWYDELFNDVQGITPLKRETHNDHAYHLYVIKLDPAHIKVGREKVFSYLREQKIGVNVHYVPVHYHPFYKNKFHTGKGMCPVAEDAYESILTIPLFPLMEKTDVLRVFSVLKKII